MKTNMIHYLSSVYFISQPQYGPIKDTMTLTKTHRKPLITHTIQAIAHPIMSP